MSSSDALTRSVRRSNPHELVEKIVRMRIFESAYWKEHCFGLTAELLVDKATSLTYYGGVCSANNKPTPFLCLIMKMLQLRPEMEIIREFIQIEEYKYVRVLAAFYLRLVGSPVDIYTYLEPLYSDYSKIAFQTRTGWGLSTVDQFIDTLLTDEFACDIALPHLPSRKNLEERKLVGARESLVQVHAIDRKSAGAGATAGVDIAEDGYSSSSSSSSEEEETGEATSAEPVSATVPSEATESATKPENETDDDKEPAGCMLRDALPSAEDPELSTKKNTDLESDVRYRDPKRREKRADERDGEKARDRRSGSTHERQRRSSRRRSHSHSRGTHGSRDNRGTKRSRRTRSRSSRSSRNRRTRRSRDRSHDRSERRPGGRERREDGERRGRQYRYRRDRDVDRRDDDDRRGADLERREGGRGDNKGDSERPSSRQDESNGDGAHSDDQGSKHEKKKKKKKKLVFKGLKKDVSTTSGDAAAGGDGKKGTEGSVEQWNDQRAKLGLKPLRP